MEHMPVTPAPSIADNEFHLGLTMAGAVSAGAYTGGVLDYLIETLKKWEEAKKGNYKDIDPALVPRHKIIIDAMGGASAGGMATTMTMMALLNFDTYKPVSDPEIARKYKKDNAYSGNIFFDSWVHLNDIAGGKGTFEQMFDTSDLKDEVASFFNSNAIDQIAERTLNIAKAQKDASIASMPPFASKEMEMVLSMCTLRGVPVDLVFDTISDISLRTGDLPAHRMYQHRLIAHFKLNYSDQDKDYFLKLDPFNTPDAQLLKKITIATGAFPFGLKMRQINEFTVAYVKNITERYLNTGGKDLNEDSWKKLLESCEKTNIFEFTAVDGGTVNNEPFGEVVNILNAKYDLKPIEQGDKKFNQFAVIMIDPFPGFADKADYTGNQNEIFSVVPKIYQTLRDQSLLKQGSSLNKYDIDYPRGMIFPKKNIYLKDAAGKYTGTKKPVDFPIACASFGAFGGFLDFEFRLHDYFLGRDNCMNFLRFFFSMTYDAHELSEQHLELRHPIHRDWTQAMIDTFKIDYKGKILLPVIPDMDVVGKSIQEKEEDRHNYTITDFPQYNVQELFAFENKMKLRIKNILDVSMKHLNAFSKPKSENEQQSTSLSARLIAAEFPDKGIVGKIIDKISARVIVYFAKKAVAKIIYKAMIKSIVTDLDKRSLLKYEPKK